MLPLSQMGRLCKTAQRLKVRMSFTGSHGQPSSAPCEQTREPAMITLRTQACQEVRSLQTSNPQAQTAEPSTSTHRQRCSQTVTLAPAAHMMESSRLIL